MNKKSTLHETPTLPSTELLAIGVWLLVLICLASQAIAAPAPKGYLARSKPRFARGRRGSQTTSQTTAAIAGRLQSSTTPFGSDCITSHSNSRQTGVSRGI